MSFFNKFKDAIWTEEGEPSKPAAPVAKATSGATSAPAPAVNDKYAQALRASINNRSTAFTALLQNAEKLVNVIPDPNMRLKAAFEMVKGEGRGIKELLSAVEIHSADLESQRMSFQQAMDKEQRQAVGSMEGELEGIRAAAASATNEIAQLQQRIQTLTDQGNTANHRANELNEKMSSEKARFIAVAQQFDAALALVRGELDGQKAVIQASLS